MKKLIACLVLISSISVMAQITGTAHDFSLDGWANNTNSEICIACHTPHDGVETVTDAPLWNHELSTVAAYGIYSTTTMDATTGQPSGVSKLCLSCHDGTVAPDSYGGMTGVVAIAAGANFGTALGDDHPISFTYNDALATTDGGLRAPSTFVTTIGGTIDNDMLFGGNVECASCHDVHGTGIASLLLIDNAGSALCLTCHAK